MSDKHLTIADGARFAIGFGLGMVVWVLFWAVVGLIYMGGLVAFLRK